MRVLAIAVVTMLALAAPGVASAQLTIGGRIGFASGFGKVAFPYEGAYTDYVAFPEVPITLDVGLPVAPFSFGAYFTYGVGKLGSRMDDACAAANVECSVYALRAGLDASVDFDLPRGKGWVGLYAGWERAAILGSPAVELTADGIAAGLQWGMDFGGGSFRYGPFFDLGIGHFMSARYGGTRFDLDDRTVHGILEVGVRGRFKL
jgi:hypothetical protein